MHKSIEAFSYARYTFKYIFVTPDCSVVYFNTIPFPKLAQTGLFCSSITESRSYPQVHVAVPSVVCSNHQCDETQNRQKRARVGRYIVSC